MRKFLVILLIAAIACVEVSNTKEKLTEDDLLKLLNIDSVEMGFIKKVVKKTMDTFGRIDILINNAGTGAVAPAEMIEDEVILSEHLIVHWTLYFKK